MLSKEENTLRTQFNLPWSPTRNHLLRTAEATSRLLLPHIPHPLRAPPGSSCPPRRARRWPAACPELVEGLVRARWLRLPRGSY